jgi:hypothetical protein
MSTSKEESGLAERKLTEVYMKMMLEACGKEIAQIPRTYFSNGVTKKECEKNFPNLFKIYDTHKGLCDIICNYFTLQQAGKPENSDKLLSHFKHMVDNSSRFDVGKLDKLSKTHLLSLVSFVELVKFVFLKTVPNNIFKKSEEKQLRAPDKGINQELFTQKFNDLPEGAYIKFSGFRTTASGLPDTGHSMLITKVAKDRYMFLDPDGTKPSCTFHDIKSLSSHVNDIAYRYDKIAFIDNNKFMKRVKNDIFKKEDNIQQQKEIKEELKQGRREEKQQNQYDSPPDSPQIFLK